MNTRVETVEPCGENRTSITGSSAVLLRNLFLHHDGIVVGATIRALKKGGILEHLFRQKNVSMQELRTQANCNSGYLHVALRCMALQGWIDRSGDPASDRMRFQVTMLGEQAARVFDTYARVADFIYSGVSMDEHLFDPDPLQAGIFQTYSGLIEECRNGWGLPRGEEDSEAAKLYEMVAHHLDGMLIAPLMIAAKQRGLLEGEYVPLEQVSGNTRNLEIGLKLLQHFDWVEAVGTRWRYTPLGRLAGQFSLHYGLTGSYFPMFCNLSELIFSSTRHVTHVQPGKEESHVDRVINVLASGVAHRRYFEDSETMIVDLFNQLPLEAQPRFVADMGCGDGEWLKRIYEVVRTRTVRGQHLEDHPLLMVGADYNVTAQAVVRQKLEDAGVPNLVLFGDVGDPEQFSRDLRAHEIDICEGLHVRAFIDHNRPYKAPRYESDSRGARSTGAYADENGNSIDNQEMEQSLCEHLAKWVPYVFKHGLIILEAHDVSPEIARRHLGKTHATAFDTYHGYSNQYPVDFEAFMVQAEKAGLRSVIFRQRLYPSRLPFVAISLNHFKSGSPQFPHPSSLHTSSPVSDWVPDGSEDLEDGNGLHHLLYRDGDISRPMRWCCYSTGLLVAEIIAVVEQRWYEIRRDPAQNRNITIVDYGAGTGFATLELIKALFEKGFLQQFSDEGVEFRLWVCDFPSGWFAQGYDLLKRHPFVSFFSLKNRETGGIQDISGLFPKESVDLVFASMVFHLIPPAVFSALADSFSMVLRPGGTVLWNTPDTIPALPYADVIHTGNRMFRKFLLELVGEPSARDELINRVPEAERASVADLADQVSSLVSRLDSQLRAEISAGARKQILPEPTHVSQIVKGFSNYVDEKVWGKLSVITDEELVALALLPANQRNVGEILDRRLRESVIGVLMKYHVLPRIHGSAAGLRNGMALHWTFGRHTRKA